MIKYMGSKASIIEFVVNGVRRAYNGGPVCDLFAGACSLSGAIGHSVPIVSNDIQSYSRVLASCYLRRISPKMASIPVDEIIIQANNIVTQTLSKLPSDLNQLKTSSLEDFNAVEHRNRLLLDVEFDGDYHLFARYYSGTWWSAEQCAWIDALREVADQYLVSEVINDDDHALFLSAVMHSMAYCGQGTGHFAQYRDAKTVSSMNDINIYRQKSMSGIFARKFDAIRKWNVENVPFENMHQLYAQDYVECLQNLEGGTVYADPPYAFVHYSRFYHALETFVLYDYPDLQIKGGSIVKGRYRETRHQSPFSIKSQVPEAFTKLFDGIKGSSANLVLSYSNTGLFALTEMIELAHDFLGSSYKIELLDKNHTHMTMGRRADRDRSVKETMLIATKK